MRKIPILCHVTLWFLLTLRVSVAATLHVIITADTNNYSISASVTTDLRNMRNLMESISSHTGLPLRNYDLSGNRFSRDHLTATLTDLTVGNDDVVIFYYAGHGGRAPGKSSRWPSLDMEDDHLDLDWVKSTLEKKKPRFLMTITDTCNTFNNSFSISSSRGGPTGSTPRPENYRQLFLNYRGYIIASGAKPGQSSWGNAQDGGFFTYAFLDSLNKDLASTNPNWYSIMKRAEAPIEVKNTVQNPQSKVDIKPAKAGVASPQQDACYYFYKPGGVLCCRSSSGTTCEQSKITEEECPAGGWFMKPGGVLCCRRPTGITCR